MTQAIEQVLTRFELLRSAVTIDPRLLSIFRAAAACEWYPGYNRWNDYERFKGQISHIVGWSGDNPALRNTGYYQVCVTAIDYLLPEEPTLIDVTFPQIEGAPV